MCGCGKISRSEMREMERDATNARIRNAKLSELLGKPACVHSAVNFGSGEKLICTDCGKKFSTLSAYEKAHKKAMALIENL